MGPAATTTTPSCFPPPDYRIAARSVKDALRRRLRRPGPARSLTRAEPLTRIGSSRETGNAQAPGDARGPVRHAL